MTGRCTVIHGDALHIPLADASVDAVVCDPPYGLEFMGKEWDAPWAETGINADAGMSGTGYTDGGNRLPRPSFTGSTNPNCLNCKGKQRGRRDGTAIVAVCVCDAPRFPNVRAIEMAAFQFWCEQWAREAYRVLKPGGFMLAFGGTRTSHRLACGIEDAGFEMRDAITWLYGQGFSKSWNFATMYKGEWCACEGEDGALRDGAICPRCGGLDLTYKGFGTGMKPASEPIIAARKPLIGNVAANVLAFGTGALNIDGCRVGIGEAVSGGGGWAARQAPSSQGWDRPYVNGVHGTQSHTAGRWPTNVVLSHTSTPDGDDACADGCVPGCPVAELDAQSGTTQSTVGKPRVGSAGNGWGLTATGAEYGDTGGASRFFPTFRYEAKAASRERPRDGDNAHPTVKPLALIQWLVRLVTPPGGLVLDCFAGSGTTGEAAVLEGIRCVLIERDATSVPLIRNRLDRRLDPVTFLRNTATEVTEATLFDKMEEISP